MPSRPGHANFTATFSAAGANIFLEFPSSCGEKVLALTTQVAALKYLDSLATWDRDYEMATAGCKEPVFQSRAESAGRRGRKS